MENQLTPTVIKIHRKLRYITPVLYIKTIILTIVIRRECRRHRKTTAIIARNNIHCYTILNHAPFSCSNEHMIASSVIDTYSWTTAC
jgi:hypothetical protein